MMILVFQNLNIAVCGEDGQQIPELQESLLSLFAKNAESHGYDPSGWIIETTTGNWKMFRTDIGWNREHVPSVS